jgi:hypothetical protein
VVKKFPALIIGTFLEKSVKSVNVSTKGIEREGLLSIY